MNRYTSGQDRYRERGEEFPRGRDEWQGRESHFRGQDFPHRFEEDWEGAEEDWSYRGGRSTPPVPGQSRKYGDVGFENRYGNEETYRGRRGPGGMFDEEPRREDRPGQQGYRTFGRSSGGQAERSRDRGQEMGRRSASETYGPGFDRGFEQGGRYQDDWQMYQDDRQTSRAPWEQDQYYREHRDQTTQDRRSEQERGRYYGVGPQGYKRSDQRLTEEACELLMREPDIDASNINVEVKDGEVILKGFVTERDMKYAAEERIENLLGVKEVHNQITVRKSGSMETRDTQGRPNQR